MSDRGMNYYAKAFQLFVRSLRPSVFRGKKTFLVGKDHLGNQYFECPADPSANNKKPSRFFKPPNHESWDEPIPPEWNAWLRMQRNSPPTEEESQRNLARVQMLKEKFQSEPKEFQKIGSFTRFPEYEESPGSKYK